MTSFLRRGSAYISRIAKLKPERVFVGSDLEGNHYYEVPHQTYWFGLYEKRYQRLAEPQGVNLNNVITLKVTPEWDAWLRCRRDDPPSIEELKMNVHKHNVMQAKITNLEMKNKAPQPSMKQSYEKPEKEEQDVESWSSGSSSKKPR